MYDQLVLVGRDMEKNVLASVFSWLRLITLLALLSLTAVFVSVLVVGLMHS